MTEPKRIIIIAGPNGAGKTTFAGEYLPKEANCRYFVNVDEVARGLNPLSPSRANLAAARLMLSRIHEHARRGDTFAFETTLAGRVRASSIPAWRARGYLVSLIFLKLPTPELAVERVRQRVLEGGHHVPEDRVRARFHAGWRNFETLYRGLVDEWVVYDNSGDTPVAIDEGRRK